MKYSQERKRSIWAQLTSYPLGQLYSLVIHQWEEAPKALPGFN